jgi:hypothetical protein
MLNQLYFFKSKTHKSDKVLLDESIPPWITILSSLMVHAHSIRGEGGKPLV